MVYFLPITGVHNYQIRGLIVMQDHDPSQRSNEDNDSNQPMTVQVTQMEPADLDKTPATEIIVWERVSRAWYLLLLFPPLLGLCFALPSYVEVWEVEIGEVNDGHDIAADTFARQLNNTLALAIKE